MAKKKPAPDDVERGRKRAAAYSAALSASARDIGNIPGIADEERRNGCQKSLLAFCQTYFQSRFYWQFSHAHLLAIDRLERCILRGGKFALAMPRGSGKTALAEIAVIWAILYGHRRYVVLFQAIERLAGRSLKKIQRELEINDLLASDFPEACYPIRKLGGIAHKCKGQTYQGQNTNIEWNADGITFPTIQGSLASGSVIHVAGLTGSVRGMSVSSPTGEILRPDLILLDDVQTRESAKSPTQTSDRESTIMDDVLGLAGPGVEIAAITLCTVIYPGDLSERMLSPEKHPEWKGVRTKMLESFPTDMDLWDQYAETRRHSYRTGGDGLEATEFYEANREAMDSGAVVSWPERVRPSEVSGIQCAMNLYYENPRGFRAEYQNEPEDDGGDAERSLNPEMVVTRLSGVQRHRVPRECSRLTVGIDVGGGLLFYTVAAWNERFGGSVIDYGTWPKQNRSMFQAADARPSMHDAYPGRTDAQRVFSALSDLINVLFATIYYRDSGTETVPIDRVLVDSGWMAEAVYQAIRASRHASSIYPSKGVAASATSAGISQWKPRPGERRGHHWRMTLGEYAAGVRLLQFDPDRWKSLVHSAMTVPMGGQTALSLFGKEAGTHALYAEHLGAEASNTVTIRGQTWDKWVVRPDRPDNHWLDTLVLAAVAASVSGVQVNTDERATPTLGNAPVQTIKLSELQAANKSGTVVSGSVKLSDLQKQRRKR